MNSDGPFCNKGCKQTYEHERKCVKPKDYRMAALPEEYKNLGKEELMENLGGLFADWHRYSGPAITSLSEYHKPTATEAARRICLIQEEILSRMSG